MSTPDTPSEILSTHPQHPVNTIPVVQSPHFRQHDSFMEAHARADTDSGDLAIHHTLNRPGGAAGFEHQHGKKTVVPITMWNNAGAMNPGSGGISEIIYQKLSRELVWVQFYLFWGTATGKIVGSGWFYDWGAGGTFLQKNHIAPVGFTVGLDAVYFNPVGIAGPGNRHGKLIWDYTVQSWNYFWDSGANTGTFNAMNNGQLTTDVTGWDQTNGVTGALHNVISAQGVYQYAGSIS